MPRALLVFGLMLVLAGCSDDDASSTTSSSGPQSTTIGTSTVATTTTDATTSSTTIPSTTTVPDDGVVEVEVSIEGGSVDVAVDGVPEAGRVEIPLGSEVRFSVTSDTADEIHIHGYDMTFDVSPGVPAVVEFDADIPGIFEVELHSNHSLLVELQVS